MDLKLIKVKNFRNYSNDELGLTDSSFWILRGKNSAGKSTLACDALTYALFGTIKAMSDFRDMRLSVDDIIKRGKRKAEVTIEFEHKGDGFKIVRTREVRGKAKGRELVNLWKNGTEILSNATKTNASNWIETNLWTYEDFTNTTLILQDEMTKALEMSISKRKDYIETIFGIKRFVEMSALSREKANEISKLIEMDEFSLQNEKNLLDELKILNAEIPSMKNTLSSKIKLHQNLIDQKNELTSKLQELEKIKNSYNALSKEKDNLVKSIEDRNATIREIKIQLEVVRKKVENKQELKLKQKKIDQLNRKIEAYETTRKNQERLLKQLELIKSTIENERSRIVKKIQEDQVELKERSNELQNKVKDLESIKKSIESKSTLEKEILQEQEITSKINELESKSKEFNEITKQYAVLNAKLESVLESENNRINDLKNKIKNKESHLQELNEANVAKDKIKKIEEDLKKSESETERIKRAVTELETNKKLLTQEIESISQNILSIQEEMKTLEFLHEEATCPTCKQKLSEDHVKTIISDTSTKIKGFDEKRKKHRSRINEIEAQKIQLGSQLDSSTSNSISLRKQLESFQIKINSFDNLMEKVKEIEQYELEITEFERNGGLNGVASDLRKSISENNSKLGQLKFNPDELQNLRDRLSEIVKKKEQLVTIIRDESKIANIQVEIKNLTTKVQTITQTINENQNILSKETYSPKERESLKNYKMELEEVDQELKNELQLREELKRLNPDDITSKIQQIEEAEKSQIQLNSSFEHQNNEITNENNKLSFLLHDLNDPKYQNLEQKLGEASSKVTKKSEEIEESLKDKVSLEGQISIKEDKVKTIDDQIKEIDKTKTKIQEQSDNKDDYELLDKIFKQIGGRILARLRNQINLETINIFNMLGNPQLQGISIKEDFSLAIQTPDGEEVASFFSGGQKIRIGFALRLALSKVLAEYRGNEVETLIIDEGGFGALDQDGQDGVVEVFTAMQDRFRRVLIISHINNIAERLPGIQVHIEEGKIVNKLIYSPGLAN